jgi:hypothetical protein
MELKKIKPIKRGVSRGIRWDLLSNEKVLNCIEKLLRGEAIDRTFNNCSIGRLANIIVELRKIVGFEGIENYHLGVGKINAYKLANDDEVKHRLLIARDEIVKRIEAKASKGIKSK